MRFKMCAELNVRISVVMVDTIPIFKVCLNSEHWGNVLFRDFASYLSDYGMS